MKVTTGRAAIAIVGISLVSVIAWAQATSTDGVPKGLTYSGFLEDGSGPVTNASLAMTFDLVAGDAVVDSEVANVAVDNGAFTATIFQNGLPRVALDRADLFLRITVGGTTLTPDQPVQSAVFAQRAGGLSFAGPYTESDGFCGLTADVAGDLGDNTGSGGFDGTAALCKAVSTCGIGAHMCTHDELLRFSALGNVVPEGEHWFGGGGGDCVGFTTQSTAARGATWLSDGSLIQTAGTAGCDSARAIACCH